MARAIWKGVIRFGPVEVPVKLYSAVEDQAVHFRLLHDQDMAPVRQRMVNSETGEEVESQDIRKGAEVQPGVFVVLNEDDMKAIEPEPSRDIVIERFVPPDKINHQWYVRPYYLGPDDGAAKDYWAFVEALRNLDREGVARWTMRNREYVGALGVHDAYLVLNTMRYAGEVILPGDLDAPGGRTLDAKELKMARQLVAALEDEFDPAEYRDEYRQRVMELIETKASGGEVEMRKPRRKVMRRSLADALEASLAAAGKGSSRRRSREKARA